MGNQVGWCLHLLPSVTDVVKLSSLELTPPPPPAQLLRSLNLVSHTSQTNRFSCMVVTQFTTMCHMNWEICDDKNGSKATYCGIWRFQRKFLLRMLGHCDWDSPKFLTLHLFSATAKTINPVPWHQARRSSESQTRRQWWFAGPRSDFFKGC